jgi:hypothetical protein
MRSSVGRRLPPGLLSAENVGKVRNNANDAHVDYVTHGHRGRDSNLQNDREHGSCIVYDFNNCKVSDPLDGVHPAFRAALKSIRGDYIER